MERGLESEYFVLFAKTEISWFCYSLVPIRPSRTSCQDTISLWHSNPLSWRAFLMARIPFTRRGGLVTSAWELRTFVAWESILGHSALIGRQHDFWNRAISKTQQHSSRESPVNTLLEPTRTKFGAELWNGSPQDIP